MTDDWLAEVQGRVPHRPKRRWWAVAARPMPSMPLDVITTPGVAAVAAYGLRKMRSSYNGPAINVRRSSDNATIDIGFRGFGDLDVQSLSTFIGAGNGFVGTWYDQTLNGFNAIQGTLGNQPQVVLAATASGMPALSASSASMGLAATIPAATLPMSLSSVASRTGNLTTSSNIVALSGGANPPALFYISSPGISVGDVGLDAVTIAGVTDNQFHSVIGILNGAASLLNVDGATATGTLSNQPGSTQIFPVAFSIVGLVSEAIYFGGALGATDIAALGANQKAYWGTVAAIVIPSVTWNPADKSATVTLSGGNVTATCTGGTNSAVRTIKGYSTGKVFWELNNGTGGWGSAHGYGLANIGAALGTVASAALGAVIYYQSNLWYAGSNHGTGVAPGGGAQNITIMVAADLDNKLLWAQSSNNPLQWNVASGPGTANPATGVGGISYSGAGLDATLYPCVTFNTSTDSPWTLNTMGPFVNTPPTGFSPIS